MIEATLLHELPVAAAETDPGRQALTFGTDSLSYAELAARISAFGAAMTSLGLARGERVGIYLDKRFETVVAAFGAAAAGAAFVPLNPLLKAAQVQHILRDCGVRILVTSAQRLAILGKDLAACPDLRHVVLTGERVDEPLPPGCAVHAWRALENAPSGRTVRAIDTDVVAILYTSGSTGRPKGVVLSHRNMVAGARSVASYLENNRDDVLLAALPLSFDAGFSQLTTAFHAGARVVLLNYLLPRDLLNALARERVTGFTGVPALYIQLARFDWPSAVSGHLRYFASTGGKMPAETLRRLRALVPAAKPYLMYGLTEAFRATYLPPEEVDRRPDSIGKAIPNVEILVLRDDGSHCGPDEPGELVQRGALVALGYWNDPERTAERFRPLPAHVAGRDPGVVVPEIAVFSGDTVREDTDGFLYFVGRRDEMIKISGYRVSPTEIEEVLYATQLIGEAAAFGVEHPESGQAIVVVATPGGHGPLEAQTLATACRERLPAYMQPGHIEIRTGPLPRNANEKIDRRVLAAEFARLFESTAQR